MTTLSDEDTDDDEALTIMAYNYLNEVCRDGFESNLLETSSCRLVSPEK